LWAADSDNISVFTIADTGDLLPLGAPVPAADQLRSMVVSPGGDFLYVENGDAHRVSTYQVDSRGGLTLLQKVKTTGYPFGIAVSPSGDAVFVTNLNDPPSVSSFAVGHDGTLEPVGDPVPAGDGVLSARGVAVSTDGRFVYLACGVSDEIMPFKIGDDGRLTSLPTVLAPDLPVSAEISRDGRFLFIAAARCSGSTCRTQAC
jgi:6-phosphogluconolactonase (cycloisomerase 2 family)